jgi:energy-coupling factor transport system permease protein
MNITIGQYYPVDSAVHRLDARTKLIGTFIYIAALFIAKGIVGYLLCCGVLIAVIKLCKVPVRLMLKGLRGIIAIIVFTLVLNILFTPGGNVLIKLGIIRITDSGIITAVRLCIRLIMLVMGTSVLTLTTSPLELTDGIEVALSPFKKIGVPAHEIAMMMSIALRFIPTLCDEADRIKKAQLSRGARLDEGNLVNRVKAMLPMLVPLFVSAFRRAEELAMAMDARCYRGGEGRTRLRVLKYDKDDIKSFKYMAVFSIAIVLIGIWRI